MILVMSFYIHKHDLILTDIRLIGHQN